jgi:hypothetical protein
LDSQENSVAILGSPIPDAAITFNPIIGFDVLQRLSGLQRPTAICDWLKSQGIAYLRAPGGRPITTVEAINRRLAGYKEAQKERDRGINLAAAARRRR